MSIFPEVIGPGDLVVEIGGHIGYLTVYFSGLVGPKGRVLVFEPGRNNLPYLRKNLASHANGTLVEKAVADFTGPATFHLENLSGQNNSLIKNYRLFAENLESAGIARVETSVMEVGCTTLDCFWSENNLPAPSFVKIDVEGAEMSVLRGMKNVVQKNDVALMVEVSENHADVFHLLKEYGFLIFDDSRRPIQAPRFISGNLFCLKENDKRTGRLLPLRGAAKNPKTGILESISRESLPTNG